jgi:hypothetical protein
MMIGIGMPSSQNNTPRPKPISTSMRLRRRINRASTKRFRDWNAHEPPPGSKPRLDHHITSATIVLKICGSSERKKKSPRRKLGAFRVRSMRGDGRCIDWTALCRVNASRLNCSGKQLSSRGVFSGRPAQATLAAAAFFLPGGPCPAR